mmetsp:Transcript_6370/g.19262  ORF Transcript_6370/g.19262 Transcript_6370/m.19262 type:complete len:632 (-) Transcript_6370:66-1961(-)
MLLRRLFPREANCRLVVSFTRTYVKIRQETERYSRGVREEVRRKSRIDDILDTKLSVALVGRPNAGKSTLYNMLVDPKSSHGHKAIVHPIPGVTRDVMYAEAVLHDLRFHIFDTAGLEDKFEPSELKSAHETFSQLSSVAGLAAADDSVIYRALYQDMAMKTALAIQKADIAFFLVDSREGLSEVDKQIANWLQKIHKPEEIILVANKYDSQQSEQNYHDLFELGLGEPVPLSAMQGLGKADLYLRFAEAAKLKILEKEDLQAISESQAKEQEESSETRSDGSSNTSTSETAREVTDKSAKTCSTNTAERQQSAKPKTVVKEVALKAELPGATRDSSAWQKAVDENDRDIIISVIGRPNVGKSTLVNKLMGKAISLTGPAPGVTRDSVWIDHLWKGKPLKLVDTAGVRKKNIVQSPVEMQSIRNTLHAIKSCHVCILVMDAQELWTQQEVRLARRILDEGRAMLIALNKWDLIEENSRARTMVNFQEKVQTLFPAVRKMKVVPISALKMQKHYDLLDSACELYDRWSGYLRTADLNEWLREFKKLVPLPKKQSKGNANKFNLLFVAQTRARPPTFTFRGASAGQVPITYLRTLENALRKNFDWQGVPIRMKFLPRERTTSIKAMDGGRERK